LGGQEVMVAVVLRPGTTLDPPHLIEFCKPRLPRFAVPRFVRYVEELPKSHAQRILKHELKAEGTEAPGVWDSETEGPNPARPPTHNRSQRREVGGGRPRYVSQSR